MLSTGAGARIGAWTNHLPESTRPGHFAFCSACESSVSHEVLAPHRVARHLQILNRMDTAGRARGLSGAPDGARGRRSPHGELHRLDPDGWLGQPTADSNSIESPASRKDQKVNSHRADTATGYGLCGKLLRTFQQIPQPRRRRDGITSSSLRFDGPSHPVQGKPCPLDKELLMGGTVF